MKMKLRDLQTGYSKKPVLHDVNAALTPGEFIGLVGPNGAGKSCLVKTMAGLIKPQAGTVEVDGIDITTLPLKLRARKIAYLAQERVSIWQQSVFDLVALGRAPYRGSLGQFSEEDKKQTRRALKLSGCENLQHRRFDHLSGGEQARVHLARALAVNAPLLLADEPTAALDPYYQIAILTALQNEVQSGKSVIASLHDLALAKQFCTRIWVLHEGQLYADDTPKTALKPQVVRDVFGVEIKNGKTILSARTPEKN